MINTLTLQLKDARMREEYGKAISTKAYEAQFHVVVAFLMAFVSSLSYFIYCTYATTYNTDNAKLRIYIDLVRFVVYFILIVSSYKCALLRAYGSSFMVVFFGAMLTELYIVLGDYKTLCTR